MKDLFKRNFLWWLLWGLCLIGIEIFFDWPTFLTFLFGTIALHLSLVLRIPIFKRLALFIGIFLLLIAFMLLKSFWLVAIGLCLVFIFFRINYKQTDSLLGESLHHPLDAEQKYHGIKLIQPLAKQQGILKRSQLIQTVGIHPTEFEWDDINLLYFGGNSIIDCGNTLIPVGETIIMIRKLFGKTRLIIPKDVGLSLNISAGSGQLKFESESYQLLGENLKWQSPDYHQATRQIKIVYSVIWGEIEVILI